jgi:hypothetical protein
VKAHSSSKYARQVTALYHGQLAVHIGEAGGTLVPGLGKGSVGGFAEKLHSTGTEPLQGFERNRAERVSGAVMVGKVVPKLVSVLKSSCMAKGVGGGMNV